MNLDLEKKLTNYYTRYYKDQCCLPDWEKRVTSRLHEEDKETQRMKSLVEDFNFDFNNKKHLIVGAGTGGLAVVIKDNYAAEVFGVEPEEEEYEIIKLRCIENNINADNFKKAYGEKLPYPDSSFDFVHCFTVLEHVQDVNECLNEMIRCVKKGGKIIINTPNYSFPYEGHYKIYFPTFLPKIFGYIYLLILRKDYTFLKSINYITEKSLNKILVTKNNIQWLRIYKPPSLSGGFLRKIVNYLITKKFIYPQQDLIITKK